MTIAGSGGSVWRGLETAMITLRENQVAPVEIGIDFFRRAEAAPSIIVAPTAFGKSIVIAKIAESVNDNLLILQPSKELLEQNLGKYLLLGGNAEIYSASFNSRKIGQVTYATIGSIKSIGKKFKELGFTKMIIDEAHLYPRESNSMLGTFLKESEITHVLGLTATPLKLQTNKSMYGEPYSKLVMLTNRSGKGNFFKDIIYISQIQEMVELNFWAKLEYEQYDIDESGLVYNTSKAEYTDASIEAVYKSNNIERMVLAKVAQCNNRNSIAVFVPSVADARALAEKVPNAVAIYGDMPRSERNEAVKGFKSGRIKTIFNVNVLSVGFDHPELDTIICARSTASLAWFYQAMGRGTRIAPNKKDCLIVDFSGNVKRFGRLEKLYYKKDTMWKLYGEGGKLLTGCPIHELGFRTEETEQVRERAKTEPILMFGQYKGEHIKDVPKDYRDWLMSEKFEWKKWNMHIKTYIEQHLMGAEVTHG